MPWDSTIRGVRPGEPVDAAVPNRPLGQLEANLRYLRELVDEAAAGMALFVRDAPVESALAVGMPVYWNEARGRYERALGGVTVGDDDELLLSGASRVGGLVFAKSSAVMADIVRVGTVELDLTTAVGGTPEAGLYYLSFSTAGRLTQTRPAVGIPVVIVEGPRVFVLPQLVDPNNDALVGGVTAVTSLTSRDPRIQVRCAGTPTAAATGPLDLALDFSLAVESDDARGGTVLKTLNPVTGLLAAGPVVEGLYAAGPGVHLVSDLATTSEDPDDPESPALYRGRIGISLTATPSVEIDPLLTKLLGATEEQLQGVTYLGLPAGRAASFTSVFRVPEAQPYVSPRFRLALRLLGRRNGTMPSLSVSYTRLSRPPAGLATPISLPGVPASMTITTTAVLSANDRVVEAVSEPVVVAAGDLVYVTVSRAASDGYAGEVGVVAQVGRLAEAVV